MGELHVWIQTHITTSFWCYILWAHTFITWKLQLIYGHSTYMYWMTAVLSEMFIFCVKELDEERYNLWVMTSNTRYSVFLIIHLWIITCITDKYRSCVDVLHIERLSEAFIVWFRVAWEIWVETYGPRHASVVFWYMYNVVMCVLPVDTYRYIVFSYATTHESKTHMTWYFAWVNEMHLPLCVHLTAHFPLNIAHFFKSHDKYSTFLESHEEYSTLFELVYSGRGHLGWGNLYSLQRKLEKFFDPGEKEVGVRRLCRH